MSTSLNRKEPYGVTPAQERPIHATHTGMGDVPGTTGEAAGRGFAQASDATRQPKRSAAFPVVLSPEDRALAPEWLPADWPTWAASAWLCPCGYLYRRSGSLIPRECVDCGPVLVQWKRCATCRQWKTREAFSVNSTMSARLRGACRPCRSDHEAEKQRVRTAERQARPVPWRAA